MMALMDFNVGIGLEPWVLNFFSTRGVPSMFVNSTPNAELLSAFSTS